MDMGLQCGTVGESVRYVCGVRVTQLYARVTKLVFLVNITDNIQLNTIEPLIAIEWASGSADAHWGGLRAVYVVWYVGTFVYGMCGMAVIRAAGLACRWASSRAVDGSADTQTCEHANGRVSG